ncbi:TIGR04076 family protein [Pseudoflavonifractor sp. 524-17]|uniref:TIGR04076 family protein n=1 Tax=Pseudoflavonifractor sp. 524-17 TaxID=2304577 RepID=UPI0013794199
MEQKEFGVEIEIESIYRPCGAGHQVGDCCRIRNVDGALKMEGFDGWCPELVQAVLANCSVLAHGGSLAWEDEQGKVRSACPDGACRVIAAIRRIPQEHQN